MATSSAMTTSNQYIKYTITVTQNSQSVTNNTSNVTVSVRCYRTNTGYTTYGTGTVYCTINGTTYSAGIDSSDKIDSTGIVLFTKTLNISHNSDGTKTLACAAWITHSQFTSSSQSYNQTLTTIPRKSSLTVANGTLGTAQTLTVSRQATSFTHTITYACGSASGTIVSKVTTTSISFTPPLSLASQNTTGTTVSITYTITTYNGSTSIGSNSYTKTCSIPSSVKPTCSLTVTDAAGYLNTYGSYIKGLSKLAVNIATTTSYGSAIASYSTTANGSTYSTASFTTDVLKSSGNLSVNTTVKDKRGRTGTASKTISVLDYEKPKIENLKVKRCNSDGEENIQGEYAQVTFTGIVTRLNDLNSATYTLQYKKSADSEYTSATISGGEITYTDTKASTYKSAIFAADTSASYDVRVTIKDKFETITVATVISTGFSIIHWLANGLGLAFGKIAELSGVLDIGFQTRFFGGILQPVLEGGTDFDSCKTPNTYTLKNASSAGYLNCPFTSGTGTLTVEASGEEGQVHQIVKVASKTNPMIFERFYFQSTWGEWVNTSGFTGKLLWSGTYWMRANQTVTLSEAISKQRTGIVLVWSYYLDSAGQDYSWNTHFIAKDEIKYFNGGGNTFLMAINAGLSSYGAKYLYFTDTTITGHATNESSGTSSCGIIFDNSKYVLRYVIGV